MKIFDMRWTFIESINGKLIPPGWLERLVDENGSGANKGKHNFPDLAKRVGCFLGHYIAWNRIVKDERKSAIVVEDDALFHISPLNLLDAPNIEDYDFIFANERMEVALPTPVDDLQIYGIKETIENRVQQGYVGSDIYYLTFMMAKSLIALADETGPSFHLDGWLLNVAAKKFPDRFGSCAPCLGGQYDSFG
jgi:GR25 family glycosyltransferase involved in LPS biosynthesis